MNLFQTTREEILLLDKEQSINWKIFFILVSPSRFDQFNSNRKGDNIVLTLNNTKASVTYNGELLNYSVQTLRSFVPKNHRFYIWEFRVIHHSEFCMGVGVADAYFAMFMNFVGHCGMFAPVQAPSFSCASDGIFHDGTNNLSSRVAKTFGSGDRITMIVDCIDATVNVSTNCHVSFYCNGECWGSVKLKNMDITREYFPTVTFHSNYDQGEICTIENCNKRNVYSVSILEVLPLYYGVVEKWDRDSVGYTR